MAKKNHHSLKYKIQAQPNKTYKDLKQKQKAKISEWMFRAICNYYREHGVMPPEGELERLAKAIYEKVRSSTIWIPYEEFLKTFIQKQVRFAERIEIHGLPEPPVPKQKKTEAEKLAIKRAQRKNRKKKEKERLAKEQENPYQNDYFYFIAGYTSGGAPYGLTWEEMGLEPYEDLFAEGMED